ncbi:MAG TPA: PAS domain-containing protein, partial [Sphingomicrobium sp.]|nr:PAS domain-containing protein [Sphingomicrobium sp.]
RKLPAARTPHGFEALVTALGGGVLDFPAMLAIADILPVMTGYVDRDLVYRFVNKPLADWMGVPRKDILGRHIREMIGAAAFAEREPLLAAALNGERMFFASEIDHPSRGPLAVQTDYVPWADASGKVNGIIALVQDVTEQRAAERALRESEKRFRRIANSAPALMWVTRIDRTRDFVNEAYAEFACGPGCDHEEARTLDWRAKIHPDDVERIVAESIAGEASGKPFTLEGRYLRHDGEYRWLRTVSQPRFGPDGELVGFIGVGSDITLAKEAELELRRQVEEQTAQLAASEAQFRAVFEAALEVMVLLKPDGTVLAVNNRREAWRHADPTEAIGTKLWEAPTMRAFPEHVPLLKRGIAAAARGKVFTTEVKMEREAMTTAYLDVSVQPVRGDDGKIMYLLFEARDITELKIAQEQLRQSQKMEALGQLTGGIAHDFNNLLTVVVGGLDIIAKRTDDAKIKSYADNALAAAERGARLTGQLLAFSRVQRLEVRPTYVAPLIQNMRPLLRNVLGPGINKQFELDEALMAVMADPTQLEVAVLNLAINARDAMPDGGVLTFSTRRTSVTGDPDLDDGDYIELTISDTGTGMPPEVAERAFEPFFTTKEVGKGTGLGLSMVYGMARQSGGAARIESTPGKGTAVTLLFRKAEEAAAEAAVVAEEPVGSSLPFAPLSILVIDDDPDVRAFIAASLEELGYRVRVASDGREGLAALERETPDLVVLDFIMPGLSGAEVARKIRAKRPDQPILFVSGYSETDAVKSTAPDAPLLAKPFRAETLQKAVRGALAPGS